jgi:hypothetical protein
MVFETKKEEKTQPNILLVKNQKEKKRKESMASREDGENDANEIWSWTEGQKKKN